MKVLITGFDPFGEDKVNPTYEAVKKMPDEISDAEIIKMKIPAIFEKSSQVVKEAIRQHQSDVVTCIGQTGGRSTVSFERIAINLTEVRIPGNEGSQPFDTTLEEDGPAAHLILLPIKTMTENVQDHSLPAYISYTAGISICSDIVYRLLHLIKTQLPVICGGFIHVPFSPNQVIDHPVGTSSVSLEDVIFSLTYAVKAVVEGKEDISKNTETAH